MSILHTPITILAQAEAWAAAAHELSSLPDFEEYKDGLGKFLRESAGWFGIDSSHFYSVNRWGGITSPPITPTEDLTSVGLFTRPIGESAGYCLPPMATISPTPCLAQRRNTFASVKKTGRWRKKRRRNNE